MNIYPHRSLTTNVIQLAMFDLSVAIVVVGRVSQRRNPSFCITQPPDNNDKRCHFDGLRLRLTHPTR